MLPACTNGILASSRVHRCAGAVDGTAGRLHGARFAGERHFLRPAPGSAISKIGGVDAQREKSWRACAAALIAFNIIGAVALLFIKGSVIIYEGSLDQGHFVNADRDSTLTALDSHLSRLAKYAQLGL